MRNLYLILGWILGMLACPELFCAEPPPVQVPAMSEQALRFYQSGNVLWVIQQLYPIILFAVILFSGFSALMRNWAKRCTPVWSLQILIYVVIFAAVLFVANLPLSYYAEYARLHQYGLSSQGIGKWFGDTLISSGITLIAGMVIVLIVYGLIKKSPRRWWFYASLLTLPFIILAVLITPLWVEPLFNKFGPMKDKALEAKILHLADCAGIEGSRVYEVDKSQDTKMLNAYVTGFGNTKRIVLWDTIIAKLTPDELLFVMGHEMGHFVLHHIEQDIVFQFALSFLLFLFLSYAGVLIKKSRKKWKVEGLGDIASLPLLLLMVNLFFLVTAPLSNAFSRHLEHEADCFGLEVTRNNHAAANAFVKLQQENLGNPSPGFLYLHWRSTHPPLADRIGYCNTYRPWKEGQPLQFQRYIKHSCQ